MTPTMTMHWVTVTGPDGEQRLEAHWFDSSASISAPLPAPVSAPVVTISHAA